MTPGSKTSFNYIWVWKKTTGSCSLTCLGYKSLQTAAVLALMKHYLKLLKTKYINIVRRRLPWLMHLFIFIHFYVNIKNLVDCLVQMNNCRVIWHFYFCFFILTNIKCVELTLYSFPSTESVLAHVNDQWHTFSSSENLCQRQFMILDSNKEITFFLKPGLWVFFWKTFSGQRRPRRRGCW